MHRRTVLATATTVLPVAVAGCAGLPVPSGLNNGPERDPVSHADSIPAASVQMTAMDNADIGRRHARFVGNELPRRFIIQRAVTTGSILIDAVNQPVRVAKPWLYDGRVYRVAYEIENERPATKYFWTLDAPGKSDDEATVPFEDLPWLDRKQFWLIGLADGVPTDGQLYDVDPRESEEFVYANADRAESALVPTPERPVIVWGPDRRARFSVTGSASTDRTLKTYRYTADQLAPSAAAYGQQLRERYAFVLSGLSAAEREIVEQAIDEGYAEWEESPPDAFWSLAETFRQHEAVEPYRAGVTGAYLVSYEGQVYWTRVIVRKDFNTGKTPAQSEP